VRLYLEAGEGPGEGERVGLSLDLAQAVAWEG